MSVVNAAVDCLSLWQNAAVTGSYSGEVLTLSSASMSGGVITLKLTGTGNGLSGSYTVSGGGASCEDAGTAAAAIIPPVTGIWTGTLFNIDGSVSGSVQIDITQGPLTTDGYWPLTGTVSVARIDPMNPRMLLPPTTCSIGSPEGTNSAFTGAGLFVHSYCLDYRGIIMTSNDPSGGVAFQGLTSNPTGQLFLTKSRYSN